MNPPQLHPGVQILSLLSPKKIRSQEDICILRHWEEGFHLNRNKPFKRWKWLCLCCIRAFNHVSRHLSCVSGLLISNKKEELTAILDHFNVQVPSFLLSCSSLTCIECTISILLTATQLYLNLFCVLQLDNPVSILNQEMSKQFLHSKNESDKYKVQHRLIIYDHFVL